ncbi:MAG: hypothetical protein L6Q98_20840 [Anaerolineae bacterium]|nr:hypothetical protein [Anaerolineae bacterium]NUQ06257.1 hypothetical protein [Anaerolineae bacterium]
MTDHEARERLKTLNAALERENQLFDRFGSPDIQKRIDALEAEIAALPEHIRREDAIAAALKLLTEAAEDYLIDRQARLLAEPADLWEYMRSLTEGEGIASRVVKVQAHLRGLGASDEDMRSAVLPAADLERSKTQLFRFRKRLADAVTALGKLDAWTGDPVAVIATWDPAPLRAEADALLRAELRIERAGDPDQRRRLAQVRILGMIAVLRRLGRPQESIDATIRSG